jgi:uracil-DNA glycosylase
MLVGQAPGDKEGVFGRPFAWTAGKTLFKWFAGLGLDESEFRNKIYMAAVCRCFPGKNPKGGDRVPSPLEISNCSRWMEGELKILKPELLIPVGKLAISQFLEVDKLQDVIGKKIRLSKKGIAVDLIALPHPSGASTWHRTEPGITLLKRSLRLIGAHPAFQSLLKQQKLKNSRRIP